MVTFDEVKKVIEDSDLSGNVSNTGLDEVGDFVWLVRTDFGIPEDYHVYVSYRTLRSALQAATDYINENGSPSLLGISQRDEMYLEKVQVI